MADKPSHLAALCSIVVLLLLAFKVVYTHMLTMLWPGSQGAIQP